MDQSAAMLAALLEKSMSLGPEWTLAEGRGRRKTRPPGKLDHAFEP